MMYPGSLETGLILSGRKAFQLFALVSYWENPLRFLAVGARELCCVTPICLLFVFQQRTVHQGVAMTTQSRPRPRSFISLQTTSLWQHRKLSLSPSIKSAEELKLGSGKRNILRDASWHHGEKIHHRRIVCSLGKSYDVKLVLVVIVGKN